MDFTCSCGARPVATTETDDKRSRCAVCQTTMLLSHVDDGERENFGIVPFRVHPDT
ncbi:MAG TPA: hypothetical protein VMU54_00295 [Planctomycetota bacterium]|nr:hypothetical protein [Planctomycetota bacterium]